MLYLLKVLLDSREALAAMWIIGAMFAVFLGCLCVALLTALFHPDPKVRVSARAMFTMLLDGLLKGLGR